MFATYVNFVSVYRNVIKKEKCALRCNKFALKKLRIKVFFTKNVCSNASLIYEPNWIFLNEILNYTGSEN